MLSHYPFLVLSLLFLIPGAVVLAFRRDLANVVGWMALASLPFAATEFLFYPTYWEPRFLFDLVNVIGFGIEDVIFVAGLGAFTSTGYAFCFNRAYSEPDADHTLKRTALRCAIVLGAVFVSVALVALAGIAMIYGSCVIMVVASAAMIAIRRDLFVPGVLGTLVTTFVYTGLCLALAAIIPGVFELAWHTEKFLDVYVLGIPVEEIMYAACSGLAATVFYPFVSGRGFVGRARSLET